MHMNNRKQYTAYVVGQYGEGKYYENQIDEKKHPYVKQIRNKSMEIK